MFAHLWGYNVKQLSKKKKKILEEIVVQRLARKYLVNNPAAKFPVKIFTSSIIPQKGTRKWETGEIVVTSFSSLSSHFSHDVLRPENHPSPHPLTLRGVNPPWTQITPLGTPPKYSEAFPCKHAQENQTNCRQLPALSRLSGGTN